MEARLALRRRDILLSMAAAAAEAPLRAAAGRPLGLALYTVRDLLATRAAEVLAVAARTGYSEIELVRNQVALLRPLLPGCGLKPVSVHFETPVITGNWQAWKDEDMPPVDEHLTFEQTIDEVASVGARNLVFNYLPPKERGELDYYRGLADKLNAAALTCRRAGLRLWYHNHNFEFARKTGGRPIDVLLSRLDFNLVSLEIDLFWVGMSGANPAEFVDRNSGRVAAIHLKDRQRGAALPRFDISSVPLSTYEEVGRGEMDFAAILAAASSAGVAHYFVEQDHSPDPLAATRRSYAALRRLGF